MRNIWFSEIHITKLSHHASCISIICKLKSFIGIKQVLMDRRRQLEFSIYPYESHTRKIVSKLMDTKELANDYIIRLKQMETYRWSVSIGEQQ